MAKVFFSYSHKDEPLRDELEKHLSMLRREGLIEIWHDRRITAGSEVDSEISRNLEEADIILLLVSVDFLASEYCYSIEMNRAIERHDAGLAKVIPIILRKCEWRRAPFGKLLAVPTDGRPAMSWPSLDDALTDITTQIRAAIQPAGKSLAPGRPSGSQPSVKGPNAPEGPRSSNLRVKKEFTDLEKDRFLLESFEYIVRYFEGSLQALSERNDNVEGQLQRIDAQRFTAAVYRGGKTIAECSISLSGFGRRVDGIAFSHDASTRGNSFNEMLHIETDGHLLFFKSMGMQSYGQNRDEKLSQEGAAESFWSQLIRPLQD